MVEVRPVPEGCDSVIPYLVVGGAAEAIDFYERAFGAEEVLRVPGADGRIFHAELRIFGSMVFLEDDFPETCGGQARSPKALGSTPISLHYYVPDVDAAVERAERAGANVTSPPTDRFWGDRWGEVEDPFGHRWSFATHVKDVSLGELIEGRGELLAEMPIQE